jgi:hypothetical protein
MKKNKSKIKCILLAIILVMTSLFSLSATAINTERNKENYGVQQELNRFSNHDECCDNDSHSVSEPFELDGKMYIFVEIDGVSYLVEEEIGYENFLKMFENDKHSITKSDNRYDYFEPEYPNSIEINEITYALVEIDGTQYLIEEGYSDSIDFENFDFENHIESNPCHHGGCWYAVGCGIKFCIGGCGRTIWGACLPEPFFTTTYLPGNPSKCWERALLCTFCRGNVSTPTTGTHNYNTNGICPPCGRRVCGTGHIWQAYESNGTQHFKRCQRFPDCIETTSRGTHTAGTGWGRSTTQHWRLCSTCNLETQHTRANHNWNSNNTACSSCAQPR